MIATRQVPLPPSPAPVRLHNVRCGSYRQRLTSLSLSTSARGSLATFVGKPDSGVHAIRSSSMRVIHDLVQTRNRLMTILGLCGHSRRP
eukprot:2971557-Rhodomonas_salina.2